jgi:DNA-binding PucR family transcriptional regulator
MPGQDHVERVQRLLDGDLVESFELGYELRTQHIGMIALGAQAEAAVRRLAVALGRRSLIARRGERTLWVWLGGDGALDMAQVAAVLADLPEASLAMGEPGTGLSGWRATHRQAQVALTVALQTPAQLTRYRDVALLAAALKDELLVRSLIETYLHPLDSAPNGALLRQTLRAYIQGDHQVSSAAATLQLDRRTIAYRLRTIEQRLKRPMHTCLAELGVALRLDELRGTPSEF